MPALKVGGQTPWPPVSEPPRLDRDQCVACMSPLSECAACAQACPSKAWTMTTAGPELDGELCDGCGRCVGVCPQRALSVSTPIEKRQDRHGVFAMATCAAVACEDDRPQMPCLHLIGWRQLDEWRRQGIGRLWIEHADCTDCRRHGEDMFGEALGFAQQVWAERGTGPMVVERLRSGKRGRLRANSEPAFDRGAAGSRRAMFGRLAAAFIEPEARPGERAVFGPTLEPDLCNGCDACAKMCPTGALALQEDGEQAAYEVMAERCTGCGLCVDVCETGAVSIRSWVSPPHSRLSLSQRSCTVCGLSFHEPLEATSHEQCWICRLRPAANPRAVIVDP
ncbi:MAG: 4Fe-4S binding protein [Geminicoccaceae bacterium]|nr:4Fe-4S binding protein [Geminicoccaceae bacterium]